MTMKNSISAIRRAAGRKGAEARWGAERRSTVTVRVFQASRDELIRRARAAGSTPADIVQSLLAHP